MFPRTDAEKLDKLASWARDDVAFFAAGACHILAAKFTSIHPGFQMIYQKPYPGFSGNHVYASDGTWAFDHNGWTLERVLIEVTDLAYAERYPGWGCDRVPVTWSGSFYEENRHRAALPEDFLHLPWDRAQRFISTFSPYPPDHDEGSDVKS
jgi:hypothetical protein